VTAFLHGHRSRVSSNTRDLSLRQQLGSWLPASDSCRYQWTAFYSHSVNSLFLLSADDKTFTAHLAKTPRRRPKNPVRAFSADSDHCVTTLPTDSIPVDCKAESNKFVFPDRISVIAPQPALPSPPATWTTYVDTLSAWETSLLRSGSFVDRRQLFEQLRSAPHLYLASDGGAANHKGSFGAVFATDKHILAECGGRSQGANPRSFRAEGYGILAVLRFVFHLRYFYFTRNTNLRF
jgi:hypothetical protein